MVAVKDNRRWTKLMDADAAWVFPIRILVADMGPDPVTGKPSSSAPATVKVGIGECLVDAVCLFMSREAGERHIANSGMAYESTKLKYLIYDGPEILLKALKNLPPGYCKHVALDASKQNGRCVVLTLNDAFSILEKQCARP